MKKILITGATGFVGSHLMNYFRDGYNPIGTTRRIVQDMQNLDLCDELSVDSFIFNNKESCIDAIIHTASELVDARMETFEQMKVFDNNIIITKNIVKIIKSLKIPVLINCSSIAVYPNVDGDYDENSTIRPSENAECFYGLSKFCAENFFDALLKKECRIVHLRFAQIYGEGMRNDRVISQMKQSVENSNTIEVYGNGERVSNFICISTVCETVECMLQWDDAKGTYNVGEETLTYLELAKRIKEKYGNEDTKIELIENGSRAKIYINTNKINGLFSNHIGDKYEEDTYNCRGRSKP